MRGYDATSYGEAFADVYDDWYRDVTDIDATVRRLSELAGDGGAVLELGVGTGRLAIPMAAAGLHVVGVDASSAMLERLTARSDELAQPATSGTIRSVQGDMVDDLPDGPFDACLVAYNTLLNLLDATQQELCFGRVAERLRPGGHFIVEAIVPDDEAPAGTDISVKTMTADRVVLSVSDHRPGEQRTEGQFVEFTEAGGVRLRPWAIRLTTLAELDAMARAASFELTERWSDMEGTTFTDTSSQHVSVYRRL